MSNSIQQKAVFKADLKSVYEALADAKLFSKVTGGAPTEISTEAGGTFSCFGGMVSGRNIELVPNQRIVQAWRASRWEPGVYSIVRFELKSQGNETELTLNHTGFPEGQEEHLGPGWQANYFEPLRKFLS